MSGGVEIRGLDRLVTDLLGGAAALRRESARVVTKTALETKRGAIQRVRDGLSGRGRSGGPSRLAHYPKSITYELLDGGLTAEVGPEEGMIQGRFGRGIEFGSAHGAPIPHMLPATDEQEPLFYEHLERIAGDLLR